MKTFSTYEASDERELIQLLKEGDKQAFTEIYNRFHKPVYRYLLSLVKIPEQAEDLVHEVFMRIWEIRGKLDIHGAFSAYIFRACHNKAIDATRKIASDRALRSELIRTYEIESATNTPSALEEDLKRYDLLLQQALDELPPQRRKVYELCKRNGRSYEEAAKELGIAHNTVKDHMSKALASLKRSLRGKGELALAIILLGEIL